MAFLGPAPLTGIINKQINVEKKKYLKEYCKYMYF